MRTGPPLNRLLLPLTAASLCLLSIAGAAEVPVDFQLDPDSSPFTVTVSALGTSDSGSTAISGNAVANLTLDTTGGDPLITGLEFTGGTIAAVSPLNLSLTVVVVIPLTVDVAVQNVAGIVDTPSPPAPISATSPDNLNSMFDASFHEVTLNQGELVVTGVISEMIDLSADPVRGAAPPGTLGSIHLTPTGQDDGSSLFDAELRLPIEFNTTVGVPTPLGEIDVDITVDGGAVAMGAFAVELEASEPADFDKDGDVDGEDFLVWQANFFSPSGATSNTGDADGDGDVDGEDFLIWQLGFDPDGGGAAVPEPTSAVATLALLAGAAFGCRRKGLEDSGTVDDCGGGNRRRG